MELYQTSLLSDANLKAYYRFESGALTTDSSGEGHTLTAISDPAEDASGKFGGAVALDGDDAYSATDHADFKPTGAFTVGGWVKCSSVGGQFNIISSWNLVSFKYYGFLFAIQNLPGGEVTLQSFRGTGQVEGTDWKMCTGTTDLDDGNWHFVVGTWDGSYLRVYADGAQEGSSVAWSNAPVYNATNYVRVGCRNDNGTNGSFFTGSLDDVFLINGTALTSDQIQSLYNRGFKTINGVATNPGLYNNPTLFNSSYLKAYYRFKEGALTTDDSGEGHTLTAISVPVEGIGKFGSGIYLSGDDAYSATDHADFKPTGNFTIGAWVKTSTSANQFIFQSFSQNTKQAGIRLFVYSSSGYKIRFDSSKNTGTTVGTDYQQVISTTNVNDGNWHFAVGTWDGTYLKLYIDGTQEGGNVGWANAPVYAATNYVRVGCQNNTGTDGTFFTGSLDDVFLFNGVALSADQIKELYSGGIKTINGLAIASVKSYNGI